MAFYEIIEAYNSKGMGLNRPILKHIAHKKGIPHSTIHLWIKCQEGIIIQQRSKNKETFPLFWDVSVAGHIDYKEEPKSAAQREAKEEIGITINIDNLITIGNFFEVHYHKSSKIMDREFKTVFLYEYQGSIQDLNLQENEVQAIDAIELSMLKSSIDSNTPTPFKMVAHSRAYYEAVLPHLSN